MKKPASVTASAPKSAAPAKAGKAISATVASAAKARPKLSAMRKAGKAAKGCK